MRTPPTPDEANEQPPGTLPMLTIINNANNINLNIDINLNMLALAVLIF